MYIFPAIDLFDKKAVRLVRGEYDNMTVYSDNPPEFAKEFENCGAEFLHLVDLEGAKSGETPNFEVIKSICENTSLKVEVGGGIRSEEVIKRYISAGVMRVILGTAAVTNKEFLEDVVAKYGEKIAVGVDIKGNNVAIHGWTETTDIDCFEYFEYLEKIGVKTVICTDISKDGLLQGTNLSLYKELSERFSIDIIASGGVSSDDDVRALCDMNVYGAIVGKAIYEKKVDLKNLIAITKGKA